MEQLIMNWDYDNPYLVCKKDSFLNGLFIEKGKKYQIYRIMYYPDTEDFIVYILVEGDEEFLQERKVIPFYSKQHKPLFGGVNIHDYFDIEKVLERALRKSKLKILNLKSKING